MKKTISLLFLFLGFQFHFSAQNVIKNVGAAEFKKAIDEKKGVVIDLRTNDEIAARGKIKGAIQIDYFAKDAEAQILKLDKKKTYLVYCAGGGRSGEAAELMHKNGFKEVINLEKGYGDWLKNGFETEKK